MITVPARLRDEKRFVVWREEIVEGRSTKVPYRANGQGRASSTNERTWDTLGAALAALTNGGDFPASATYSAPGSSESTSTCA